MAQGIVWRIDFRFDGNMTRKYCKGWAYRGVCEDSCAISTAVSTKPAPLQPRIEILAACESLHPSLQGSHFEPEQFIEPKWSCILSSPIRITITMLPECWKDGFQAVHSSADLDSNHSWLSADLGLKGYLEALHLLLLFRLPSFIPNFSFTTNIHSKWQRRPYSPSQSSHLPHPTKAMVLSSAHPPPQVSIS
jgi:hypothetical protein